MIASTISRIIARVLRWSSTGNAAVPPDRCRVPPMSPAALPKYSDSAACSKPTDQSGVLNHTIPGASMRLSNHRALVKSP
jgi:hypothetical protein